MRDTSAPLPVNRQLADPEMDRIDHALGRPFDPLGPVSRNYYYGNAGETFRAPNWQVVTLSTYAGPCASVTMEGRKALADYLKQCGDPLRHFVVAWDGLELDVLANTHGMAKYQAWLRVSDCRDLAFRDFMKDARARLARRATK